MKRRTSKIISVVLASAALTGCASTPETSRSAVSVQLPQAGSLTALQRQFRAQTETVVYFDFDLDMLDAEARARLDEQAEWILEHKNILFRVYGHTDRVGGGTYNYDLGLRRANRVVDYLVSKGIARERLEALVSFGEDAPAVDTEDRERLNRRVVTEVHEYILVSPSVKSAGIGDAGDPSDGSGSPSPTPVSSADDPAPTTDGDDPGGSGSGDTSSGKNPNSGRGNGDEAGDPGKSQDRNNGGDEV